MIEIIDQNSSELSSKFSSAKECLICTNEIESPKQYIPRCKCSLCANCISNYLKTTIESISFNIQDDSLIKCPNEACKSSYTLWDWMGNDSQDVSNPISSPHRLPIEQFEEIDEVLLKKCLQNEKDIRFCPNNECSSYGFLPKDFERQRRLQPCTSPLECEQCSHTWFDSQMRMNTGILNRLTEFLTEFTKFFVYKKCPKCKKHINKRSGCNHMKCLCEYNFCWICLRDYNHHTKLKCTLFQSLYWSPITIPIPFVVYKTGFHIKLWAYFLGFMTYLMWFFLLNIFTVFLYLIVSLLNEADSLQSQLVAQGYNQSLSKKKKTNQDLAIVIGVVAVLYLASLVFFTPIMVQDLFAFFIIEASSVFLLYQGYNIANFFYCHWLQYVY